MLPAILLFAFAPDLTVDDVISEFRQNAFQAATIRIQWKHTITRNAEAKKSWHDYQKSVHEKDAADKSLPESARIAARQTLESLKQSESQLSEAIHIQQDFWSDRESFQIRAPCNQKLGAPFFAGAAPTWVRMPDSEVTEASLASDFSSTWIISCGRMTNRQFLIWEGRRNRGYYSGIIEKNLVNGIAFPPFSMPRPEWGGTTPLIDEFFKDDADSSRLLGDVVIDGMSVIVMERRWKQGDSSRILVGYLDEGRGCVPLRIEVYLLSGAVPATRNWRTPYDLNQITPHEAFPIQILKDVIVEQIDGTMFYPMRGNVHSFAPMGLQFGSDILSMSTEAWEAISVEQNRSMPPESFAFQFPENTIFADQTKGELRLTGDVDEAALRIVGGIVPASDRKGWYAWCFAVAVFVLTAVVAGYFRWQKRSA